MLTSLLSRQYLLIETVSVDEPTTTVGWKILSEEREKKRAQKANEAANLFYKQERDREVMSITVT